MTQLILTQTKYRLLLLASGLLLLALLSGSLNLSRAAGGETGGRYRPGETPAGLTAAEWAQVRAHIEGAQSAASPLPQGEGVGVRSTAQQAYLKASNTGAGDGFYEVALSGDTLAVGAPGEASNAGGSIPLGDSLIIRPLPPGRSMCLPAAAGYGASKPISKPPTPGRLTGSAQRWPWPATPWPWGRFLRTAARPGSTAIKAIIRLMRPGRYTCLPAAAGCGANRRMSKPPTPGRMTALASRWPCRATPWPWERFLRAAARPGSAAIKAIIRLLGPGRSIFLPAMGGVEPASLSQSLQHRGG